MTPASYRTLKWRLPAYAEEQWRQRLSAACARHTGLDPASLVLYDVSTLYFETERADGFREPGFSKERRLEPQITIGLLTGQDGFPLMVSAFEGNKAETKTMLPVIEAFMAVRSLPDVTVVADAGMISEANQKAIEAVRAVVHPRHEDPRRPLPGRAVAARAPGRGYPRRARLHPTLACRAVVKAARPGHLLQLQGRPGIAGAPRDRRAGRQRRESGLRVRPGQAKPVHPARRRHEKRQPRAGGEGQGPGGAEGLRHQPSGLSRRHPRHRGLRHQLLPPVA